MDDVLVITKLAIIGVAAGCFVLGGLAVFAAVIVWMKRLPPEE